MRVRVRLETLVRRSFRVEQVAGMLDVALPSAECGTGSVESQPSAAILRHTLTAEVPGLDEKWRIGAIVGPSGSGKTTLARAAFGEMCEAKEWPKGRAVVEVLGNSVSGREGEGAGDEVWSADCGVRSGDRRDAYPTIKQIARVLTAVGLGSVPTWLKPYEVLSIGERFRVDLARAVLEGGARLTRRRRDAERQREGRDAGREHLLVFDEFTSSLDRLVGRTTSGAVARLLRQRSEETALRLVAVTCHSDILPWLAPDWVLELGGGSGEESVVEVSDMSGGLAGASGWCGEVIRPKWGAWPAMEAPLEIRRVPQAMWERFARHHYLSGGLAASATCYGAFMRGHESGGVDERENGRLVGFCAVVAALGWKATKRIGRLVVLPEFQGLGTASRMLAEVARIEAARGNRVTITASHPAIVGHCSRSGDWQLRGVKKSGSTRQRYAGREVQCSQGRAVASFEFVG